MVSSGRRAWRGEIITRLNTLIVKIGNTLEIREAMVKQGLEVQTTTPEEFAAFIRSERAQNAKLVKFAGIKIE